MSSRLRHVLTLLSGAVVPKSPRDRAEIVQSLTGEEVEDLVHRAGNAQGSVPRRFFVLNLIRSKVQTQTDCWARTFERCRFLREIETLQEVRVFAVVPSLSLEDDLPTV